jgi:hypothetical protein
MVPRAERIFCGVHASEVLASVEIWSISVMASRVENRRSNCSLPVVSRRGFRLVTSVRFGLVLFPVPAHRTGLAVFPHPALGKDSRFRPRKVRGPVWQLDQAIHRVQRRLRKTFVCRPRLFVFVA